MKKQEPVLRRHNKRELAPCVHLANCSENFSSSSGQLPGWWRLTVTYSTDRRLPSGLVDHPSI